MSQDDEEEVESTDASTTVYVKNYYSNYHVVDIYQAAISSRRKRRKKSLGFCETPECLKPQKDLYRVEGRTKTLVTDKKSLIDCPKCKHALFWSQNYQRKDGL